MTPGLGARRPSPGGTPRPQSPCFSAQGLPGSRAGSGPVRGAAGGDQGGGGEGLLAADRLTPRRRGPRPPAGVAPAHPHPVPSTGGRARPRTSWTQRRSQPLPRIPPPHATAASINQMDDLLPAWPESHWGPLSFSYAGLSERPRQAWPGSELSATSRLGHSSLGPQFPHGGGPRGKQCKCLPSRGTWERPGVNRETQSRVFREISPKEKERVYFLTPNSSTNCSHGPKRCPDPHPRNLRICSDAWQRGTGTKVANPLTLESGNYPALSELARCNPEGP